MHHYFSWLNVPFASKDFSTPKSLFCETHSQLQAFCSYAEVFAQHDYPYLYSKPLFNPQRLTNLVIKDEK